jgi:hypothetical protein
MVGGKCANVTRHSLSSAAGYCGKKAAFNRKRGKVSIIMVVRTFDGVAPATGNEIVQYNTDQRGLGCYRGSFQDKLAYLFFHKWRGRKVVLWSEERRERYVVRYPYNEFEV